MKAMLIRKGLWYVVDGSESRPAGSDNTKNVRSFVCKQAEAIAEITLALDSSQLSFITSDDPKAVWDYLATIHQARGVSTRLTLRHRFNQLEKSVDKSMQSFISTAHRLAAQLEEVGTQLNDEDMILAITGGLLRSYNTFIITLNSAPADELTLDYVISRLLNEELHQSTDKAAFPRTPRANPSNAALTVSPLYTHTPIEHITCFNCGKKGHYQDKCPTLVADKANDHTAAAVVEDSENNGDGVWACIEEDD